MNFSLYVHIISHSHVNVQIFATLQPIYNALPFPGFLIYHVYNSELDKIFFPKI